MITVLVVAPIGVARAGLAGHLAARGTLRVVHAHSTAGLAGHVERVRPDVLLLDLGDERAAPVLRDLARVPHPPPSVVIADHARGVLGRDARAAGVRGVLPRNAGAEEIAAAVEAAAAGLFALHPDALDAVPLPRVSRDVARDASPLTAREIEILGMIAEGLGNKQVAARLGISDHTVKFHIASIFSKLGAGSRTEAVTIGLRQGLILI